MGTCLSNCLISSSQRMKMIKIMTTIPDLTKSNLVQIYLSPLNQLWLDLFHSILIESLSKTLLVFAAGLWLTELINSDFGNIPLFLLNLCPVIYYARTMIRVLLGCSLKWAIDHNKAISNKFFIKVLNYPKR
jgi:hypothetical protein